MFIHKKELLHPVVVTQPSSQFAQFLLEQFGGATGELSAGLQYFVQAQHTDDPNLRDMLLDIATEEFGHLEIVAHLIEAHTKGEPTGAGLPIHAVLGAWQGSSFPRQPGRRMEREISQRRR